MTVRSRRRTPVACLALALAAAACTSPEGTRMRSGGPGADPGNKRGVVQMHEGADPYWGTPRHLGENMQGPTQAGRQADRLSRDEPDASASPAQPRR